MQVLDLVAVRSLIDEVGPSLGCDFTRTPSYVAGRTDVCLVERAVENGLNYGYDVVYIVWLDSDSKMKFKEVLNTKATKDYMVAGSATMKDEQTVVLDVSSGGAYSGEPWKKTIEITVDTLVEIGQEKLPRINMVYRDNHVYAELAPKIISELQSMSRSVSVKMFPRETSEADIQKYFTEIGVNTFEGAEVLADNTCLKALCADDYSAFAVENHFEVCNLDSLKEKIIRLASNGGMKDSHHESCKDPSYIDTHNEISFTVNLITKIIQKSGKPNMLYIVANSIGAHGYTNALTGHPVRYLYDTSGLSEDEIKCTPTEKLKEMIRTSPLFTKTVDLGIDKDQLMVGILLQMKAGTSRVLGGVSDVWNQFVAGELKKGIASVMSEDAIKIVAKLEEVEDSERSMVLVDGHATFDYTLQKDITSYIKVLDINPLGLLHQAKREGLCDLDLDMDTAVEVIVKEAFRR